MGLQFLLRRHASRLLLPIDTVRLRKVCVVPLPQQTKAGVDASVPQALGADAMELLIRQLTTKATVAKLALAMTRDTIRMRRTK